MRFILIRHPKVDVPEGWCYGAMDVPVNSVALAHTLRWMQTQFAPDHPLVYTSPLSRCANLAQAFFSHVVVDARLQEMSFGHWEGKTWEEIGEYYREELDAWAANPAHYVVGGTHHTAQAPHLRTENVWQFAQRVKNFIDDSLAQHVQNHAQNHMQQNTSQADHQKIIITHAGVIRCFFAIQQADKSNELASAVQHLTQHTIAIEYNKRYEFEF